MGILSNKPPEPKKEPEPEKPAEEKKEDELEEFQQVALWRLTTLMDAGYPLEIAEQIGRRFDIDLHEAVRYANEGCPPITAAKILL